MSDKPVADISVCVCTMDRPAELAACLDSIHAGDTLPAEIVVSDDSRCNATRALCAGAPLVRYVEGPRRGQGPNRQAGAQACRSGFVSFVDDDAVVGGSFLRVMAARAATSDGKTIFAGRLLEHGRVITPTNLTFWGHFGAPVRGRHETVIFASNLFPRRVFDEVSFEPRIKYGYEDSDFCTQALALGYRIEFVSEACNEHRPSQLHRAASLAQSDYARYYTGLKRYFAVQRRPVTGLAFAVSAPWQTMAAAVRRGNWSLLKATPTDFIRATRDFLHDHGRTLARRVNAGQRLKTNLADKC